MRTILTTPFSPSYSFRRSHQRFRSYECSVCNRRYQRKWHCERHVSMHLVVPESEAPQRYIIHHDRDEDRTAGDRLEEKREPGVVSRPETPPPIQVQKLDFNQTIPDTLHDNRREELKTIGSSPANNFQEHSTMVFSQEEVDSLTGHPLYYWPHVLAGEVIVLD